MNSMKKSPTHTPFSLRMELLIGAAVLVVLSSVCILFLPSFNLQIPYLWMRFLHIMGAILLLGNLITGAFWSIVSDVQKSPATFRFTIRAINTADIVFTTPGALLLLWNGFFLAHQNWGGLWQAPWLRLALILFIIVGFLWVFILIPIQIHFERYSEDLSTFQEIYQSSMFKRWKIKYFVVGGVSGVLALLILVLMTLKPTF